MPACLSKLRSSLCFNLFLLPLCMAITTSRPSLPSCSVCFCLCHFLYFFVWLRKCQPQTEHVFFFNHAHVASPTETCNTLRFSEEPVIIFLSQSSCLLYFECLRSVSFSFSQSRFKAIHFSFFFVFFVISYSDV